jgi:excinuclease UvrABC ATPase subunit
MEKPKYDSIRGLSPTIAIEQKSASNNPRSTVGTVTEIHDHLRVLFARVGTQFCHQCGSKVGAQTAQEIADTLCDLPAGTDPSRGPIARPRASRKAFSRPCASRLSSRGGDGTVVDLSERIPKLDSENPSTTARHDFRFVAGKVEPARRRWKWRCRSAKGRGRLSAIIGARLESSRGSRLSRLRAVLRWFSPQAFVQCADGRVRRVTA